MTKLEEQHVPGFVGPPINTHSWIWVSKWSTSYRHNFFSPQIYLVEVVFLLRIKKQFKSRRDEKFYPDTVTAALNPEACPQHLQQPEEKATCLGIKCWETRSKTYNLDFSAFTICSLHGALWCHFPFCHTQGLSFCLWLRTPTSPPHTHTYYETNWALVYLHSVCRSNGLLIQIIHAVWLATVLWKSFNLHSLATADSQGFVDKLAAK